MVDGGYFLNFSVFVSDKKISESDMADESVARKTAVFLTNSFVDQLRDRLKQLPAEDMARPSIQKNCLTKLEAFNLLPADQGFLLGLMDNVRGALQFQVHLSHGQLQ